MAASMKMTVFWDIVLCSLIEINLCYEMLALMMQAVSTSETSVNFYQTTWRNIPEDSHLLAKIMFLCYMKIFIF
jgi:hypothetical protein